MSNRTQDFGQQVTNFLVGLLQAIIAERLAKYLVPRIGAWWTRFKFKPFIIALPLCATVVKSIEGAKDSRPSPFVRFCLRVLLLLIPFGIRSISYLSKMRLDAQRYLPYSLSNRSAYLQQVKEHPPDQPTIWLCLASLFLSALKGSALSVVRA
jgi:hypothetical protein